jgi:hypothetical protein
MMKQQPPRSTATRATRRAGQRRYDQSPKGKARHARYNRKAAETPGTYRYNEYHGIGRAGEAKRERDRRLRERRLEQGLCASCGKNPVLAQTECHGCRAKRSVRGADRMIAKYEYLF